MKKFKACLIDKCAGNADCRSGGAHGYCSSHYQRMKKYGDPLAGGTSKGEVRRFVAETALPFDGDDCLPWPYGRSSSGYGSINVGGTMVPAHRYVCTLAHGEPPTQRHEAAHICGQGRNNGCVNPKHLSWKTPAENAADKNLHGTKLVGEAHPNAKISDDQARMAIRMKGVKPAREIADELGVSRNYVYRLQGGNRWAFLQAPALGKERLMS